MEKFFLEYIDFGGLVPIFEGFIALITFSDFSHWKTIFFGFVVGIIVKKLYTKEWNHRESVLALLAIPSVAIFCIFILSDNATHDDKKYYSQMNEKVAQMDADYNTWRKSNPQATVNPEWSKDHRFNKREVELTRDKIITKLSNQFFFFIFILIGLLYKKHTFKSVVIGLKNDIKGGINQRKSQKLQADNEQKQAELKANILEEKRLELELEKERTKQREISANVQLKKIEKERPEKEEKLSAIINKIDDL